MSRMQQVLGRRSVRRGVSLLVVAIAFTSPCRGEAGDRLRTGLIHESVQALTDVMMHDIFSPPQASRAYAYATVALYEALRHQNPSYTSYASQLNGLTEFPEPEHGAQYDWVLAGTYAFFRVGEEFVFSQARLRASGDAVLGQLTDSDLPEDVVARSLAYGERAAKHILAWASRDGYAETRTLPRYATRANEPGAWEPTPPAYMDAVEPHWGRLRPFVLESGDQFGVEPPAPFDLNEDSPFLRELVEVQETGRALTKEQREIADFWDCNPFTYHQQGHLSYGMKKISPGGHWMGIAAIAIEMRSDDPVRAAASYSMVALALADGFIAAWDEKYRSNRIRPETAIRKHLEASWQPLLQTPPFPEYPSAHSVISRAAATVLTHLYGDGFAYTDDVEESFGLPPRHFDSFFQASDEAALSRLYGGIHYQPAILAGVDQGRRIGEWIVRNVLLSDQSRAEGLPDTRVGVLWGVRDNVTPTSVFESELTLMNEGSAVLGGDWVAYFNFGRRIDPTSLPPTVHIEHVNGDFYRLEPTDHFEDVEPGGRYSIPFRASNWAIKEVDAPAGFYFIFSDAEGGSGAPVSVPVTVEPFRTSAQTSRGDADVLPVPTAASRFEENRAVVLLPLDEVGHVVPTPLTTEMGQGSWTLDASATIRFERGLRSEADYLARSLEPLLGVQPATLERSPTDGVGILLVLEGGDEAEDLEAESYELAVSSDSGVKISARAPAGIFYGIQTLRALLPVEAYGASPGTVRVPEVSIADRPRFGYRGMHLDVARSFQPKDAVEKLLDLMAFYKLNRFHFHLTEDEGWRLEIRPLPELTQVAGRRGHTVDERDRLVPSFGSGPYPDVLPGSGYYTREEFVDLLRFANERHIRVIPEIEVPGHARGAIKAMEARNERLRAEGRQDAELHRLRDSLDRSVYRSVQGWDDNVVNVCLESTYRFLSVVFDELVDMYREAGSPLDMIHVGGDEVPPGVWEDSPACAEFVATTDGVDDVQDLDRYFIRRVVNLLAERGLGAAGWEEIGLHERHQEGSVMKEPDPILAEQDVTAYFWNSVWGWGAEEIGYRMANAGLKVVLANASNLYFDMAYDKDPEEPGFYWAAFVDTRNVFEFEPLDLYKSARMNQMGHPIAPDAYDAHVRLTEEGRRNILGIQGQLWGETVVDAERMEYMTFPRLIALAERAWAARPRWAATEDRSARNAEIDTSWNDFANRLGQRELKRLDYLHGGVQYRIPPPGGVVSDGMLHANVEFPGLAIHYTMDGTTPTLDSSRYYEPVPVGDEVLLRTFDSRGRGSRVVRVGLLRSY